MIGHVPVTNHNDPLIYTRALGYLGYQHIPREQAAATRTEPSRLSLISSPIARPRRRRRHDGRAAAGWGGLPGLLRRSSLGGAMDLEPKYPGHVRCRRRGGHLPRKRVVDGWRWGRGVEGRGWIIEAPRLGGGGGGEARTRSQYVCRKRWQKVVPKYAPSTLACRCERG